MQSEEIKTQNEAAGISGMGYRELNRLNNETKEKLKELYQKDLIGTLSELHTYFGFELYESREGQQVFQRLVDFLDKENYSFREKDAIIVLANEYGIASEECGFRRGFQTAMRLCMEGMKGASCIIQT